MKQNQSHTPKTLKIITSILVTTFLTGALIPTISAGRIYYPPKIPTMNVSTTCSYMIDVETSTPNSCKTCVAAVKFAVRYMLEELPDRVKALYPHWYLMKPVDFACLTTDCLLEGVKESGYQIDIDAKELINVTKVWIEYLVRPFEWQRYPITIFLAILGSIAIGVTDYLIGICNGETNYTPYSATTPSHKPLFKIWSLVLHLFGN